MAYLGKRGLVFAVAHQRSWQRHCACYRFSQPGVADPPPSPLPIKTIPSTRQRHRARIRFPQPADRSIATGMPITSLSPPPTAGVSGAPRKARIGFRCRLPAAVAAVLCVLLFWPTPARSDRPPSPSPVETILSISRLIRIGDAYNITVTATHSGCEWSTFETKTVRLPSLTNFHAYQNLNCPV